MKLRSLLSSAVALVASAFAVQPLVGKDSPSVTVRVDVDRTVLPADSKEKAVVKIALDGVKLPRERARRQGHGHPVRRLGAFAREGRRNQGGSFPERPRRQDP